MTATGRPAAPPTPIIRGTIRNQLNELDRILTRLPDTPTTRDYLTDLHTALAPYLTHGHRLTTTTTSSKDR